MAHPHKSIPFQHYSNLPLASSLSHSLYSSPQALPPPPLSVLIHSPSHYYPMPQLPPPPSSFIPAWALWTLPVTLPVNHAFHFGSPSTAYTGPVIHCLSLCPYRPSSVLQTSVGPGPLICSAFYTPPALNLPPYPAYLTHKPHYSDPLVV